MGNLAQNNENQNYYSNEVANQTAYPFILPELPYAKNAFEPNLSEKSFEFHHGKHHNAYVTNLNNLLKDNPLNQSSLEEIIMNSYGDASKAAIFNNAAQIWNHTFFWSSIIPNGGGMPKGTLLEQINKDFGSYDSFKEQFKAAGVGQFGSGWAWLVFEEGRLAITKTANADTPLVHHQKAILACDVWEHAYYIDYQNRRPDFLDVFLGKLVNWDFAESNFLN